MRKKTVEKIKKIINEVIGRKYWGNRIAMPYYNAEHGDISWEDLAGSPADSNSFMSYMVLHYYDKAYLDPKLEDIEDTLYTHVEDESIHVTSTEKSNWNNHINNSTIHVTAQDKTKWNGVLPVIVEITAHQTVNTYEVPTITVDQVTTLYNSVVAGRTTQIHFDPSELGITTDYQIQQSTNVEGVGIRFLFNDTMILTYTIKENEEQEEYVKISYKDIGGSNTYIHHIHFKVVETSPPSKNEYNLYFVSNSPTLLTLNDMLVSLQDKTLFKKISLVASHYGEDTPITQMYVDDSMTNLWYSNLTQTFWTSVKNINDFSDTLELPPQ